MRSSLVLTSLLLGVTAGLSACGGGDPDARVTATLHTGMCDWYGDQWLGVERVSVAVEYAPGSLPDRSLPTMVGSCSLETILFADEARFDNGAELPKVNGTPRWASVEESGSLTEEITGLWTGSKQFSGGCTTVADVAPDGFALEAAGDLDGITTPPPGSPGLVYIDGELEHDWTGVVQRGNPLPLSWDGAGWDETFVQIRQVNGGNMRQTLTCNTTGLSSFKVDNSVWGQLDDVGAEAIEVYVGFQNVRVVKQKGETVEAITRIAHSIETDE